MICNFFSFETESTKYFESFITSHFIRMRKILVLTITVSKILNVVDTPYLKGSSNLQKKFTCSSLLSQMYTIWMFLSGVHDNSNMHSISYMGTV